MGKPSISYLDNSNKYIKFAILEPYGIYEVGDTGPAGGIVFYITDGGAHGLEAAPADLPGTYEFGCYGIDTDASAKSIGSGADNTAEIVKAICTPLSPAHLVAGNEAASYSLNGYDNWFLPSTDELNVMWDKLADSDGDGINGGLGDPNNLGGFYPGGYWSSSEGASNSAWFQYFQEIQGGGNHQSVTFRDSTLRVRAVRAF